MSPLSDSPLVVGVDGSTPSMAAVTWAARRAARTGARVHLVNAFAPDLPMSGFGELSTPADFRAQATAVLKDGIAGVHAVGQDIPVTASMARGFAAPALIAASHDAQAIIVGTTGYGLLGRMGVGGVAMQVATHAACPVVLVGDGEVPPPGPATHVTVGVDGSENSLRALDQAVQEAAIHGATLDVVHVWQAQGINDPTLAEGASWTEYEARIRGVIEKRLAKHKPLATPPVIEIVRGDPLTVLAGRLPNAAAMVVGCRGAGGFPGLKLGQVALGLLGRQAHCPLHLIR